MKNRRLANEISWEKVFSKIYTEKDLRLKVRLYLKEHLRGLPPHFRIEVKVLTLKPPRVAILLPIHSEWNLIRAAQVDRLVADLESKGLRVEVFYEEDSLEKEACGVF